MSGQPSLCGTLGTADTSTLTRQQCQNHVIFLTCRHKACIITIHNKGVYMTNHEQIVAAYDTYIAENEKFTAKGVKAAAARARKALQEMSKGIKERRKEITAEKEALATAAK